MLGVRRLLAPLCAAVLCVATAPVRAAEAEPIQPTSMYPPVPTHSAIPPDPIRVCDAGRCTIMSRQQAADEGYLIVSLDDRWAPHPFQDYVKPSGRVRTNTYRARFVGLANELVDIDGDPLERWEQNFLELYGIPPALSLVMRRWRRDRESAECFADIDFDAIASYEGKVRFRGKPAAWIERRNKLWRVVKKAMKKAQVKEPDALLADERHAKAVQDWQEADRRVRLVEHVQRRLKCEGVWSRWRKVRLGQEDRITQEAVGAFERKHRIFGYGHLRGPTLEKLGMAPDRLNHSDLVRVITERVIDAAGVVEDGSVESRRNLAKELEDAVVAAMGIETPEKAFDWFDRIFTYRGLAVAFRPPPLPDYYSDPMDLRLEIDRGDVWYEPPYDERGKRRQHRRKRRPMLTVFVRHQGQEIPLVHWKTTIGAWRTEMLGDGYIYLRYKNSDVGPRVMHQIIAAPVWIPPESTPIKEMVKRKRNKETRKREWVVNYDEMGPGYLSAYGLMAGYLVEQRCRQSGECREVDHGIRIHGSSDYMSILARYSHGCHRLYNHLALRLYNFVLRHRNHRVVGETVLDYEREFRVRPKKDMEPMDFKIELVTRGFRYMLDPPLPVEVLEGRVLGEIEEPIEDYVRIMDREYAADAWVPPEGGKPVPPPRIPGAACRLPEAPPDDFEGSGCTWQGEPDALQCVCPTASEEPAPAEAAATGSLLVPSPLPSVDGAVEGTAGPAPGAAPETAIP